MKYTIGAEICASFGFTRGTLTYIIRTTPEIRAKLIYTARGPLFTEEAVELVRQRDEEIRASGRGRPRKARAMVG